MGTLILIVNADDFGLTEGVTRGIIEAHETGIVTSTSLMVRQPAAEQAAEYARSSGCRLDVGLHLDLVEWIYRDGEWERVYEVVPTDDPARVEAEIAKQVETFHRLLGRPPTHLDSHQHVHRSEPIAKPALAMARKLGIPLRESTPGITYCGSFYGQTGKGEPHLSAITLWGLLQTLARLTDGITELACHPGYSDGLASSYRAERDVELRTLTDPATRRILGQNDIRLATFTEVATIARPTSG